MKKGLEDLPVVSALEHKNSILNGYDKVSTDSNDGSISPSLFLMILEGMIYAPGERLVGGKDVDQGERTMGGYLIII